ncbi:hypothetical protein J5500_03200 [Candidatus Saccharibacteria bacterium]|nr:hypothetical protein [Candidatus Saccharibacteria bacterium]
MNTNQAYCWRPNKLKTNEMKQNSSQPKNNISVNSNKKPTIINDKIAAIIQNIFSPPDRELGRSLMSIATRLDVNYDII